MFPVRRTADYTAAALILFVVLFWRLGVPTFWDPDEAHYAETTREMLAAGDWWAPYYNERPFFDKPVLFYQLQGVAMVVVGPTELAARIVPALAALGLVAITVWFGAIAVSWPVGLTAGLLLSVNPAVFGLARYAILDIVFTAFTFGGAALVSVAALRDRPHLQWPGYVALALAVLTKGPLALVLCGLTLFLACLASADARRRLLGLHWILGLLIVLAVAAPWFIYMFRRFGQDFVNGYVLDENLRLYATGRFSNQPGAWFYFRILAAGLLPWTGLVVGRLFDDVRAASARERLDTVEVLLWAWAATVVGFFTFSSFKLDHYVFPAAPALCLIAARAWADAREDRVARRHAGARVGLQIVGPLLVAVGLGCGYFVLARLALPRAVIVVPLAITAAGAMLTVLVTVRGRAGVKPPQFPWIAIAALVIVYAGVIAFVMPALEQHKVVPDVARWVAAKAHDGDRVASYRLNRWNPAFRFYVARHVEFLNEPSDAEAFFGTPQPFYCVMLRSAFDKLVGEGIPLVAVYEREGIWATSGHVLWRGRIRSEHFVVATRPLR